MLRLCSALRSLFVRRETRELQAAQLLALGVRTSPRNSMLLRLLQALGRIRLDNNAIVLVAEQMA